jgi:hypothetical protein
LCTINQSRAVARQCSLSGSGGSDDDPSPPAPHVLNFYSKRSIPFHVLTLCWTFVVVFGNFLQVTSFLELILRRSLCICMYTILSHGTNWLFIPLSSLVT